ncbi:diguanylate cyclase [Thermosulfuriphilus ammonigenes]|uniref:diguanylate cyclase n=1 Tax=Thermosulfuriphilus ammonigenes TaxID=1936021 RepID=A0A6G7PYT4_9BACT|nr:diguanylate cyclase [Thermosulfuriphilus ammonigenes]MBA2849099.1 diguanylate cyclase (GGDEF)-like protein [Thermosulfuriphilus ammonigenes]QIJ72780.1 diguanylate cyclase [Thermosulfuriphilus ammonigenes]
MARVSVITKGYLSDPKDRLLLEAKGYQLAIKADLQSAVESLFNDPPDLLIIEKDLTGALEIEVIKALKNNLQLALLPIILVVGENDVSRGIDWEAYPVDDFICRHSPVEHLLNRVELAFARAHRVADNNPLTKLPGNSSILKAIQEAIEAGRAVVIGYVDIDNFKPYNDRYGFARGDEVIRMLARILVNVITEKAPQASFVGHVGGDDFVFICPLEVAEEVAREVIRHFDSLIKLFVDEEDLEAGEFVSKDRQGNLRRFPLPSISIAMVVNLPGRYSHYGEVASVAAQIKKAVKKIPGSTYLLDRRQAPSEQETSGYQHSQTEDLAHSQESQDKA